MTRNLTKLQSATPQLQQQALRRSSVCDNVFCMTFQHVRVAAVQNVKNQDEDWRSAKRLILKSPCVILDEEELERLEYEY